MIFKNELCTKVSNLERWTKWQRKIKLIKIYQQKKELPNIKVTEANKLLFCKSHLWLANYIFRFYKKTQMYTHTHTHLFIQTHTPCTQPNRHPLTLSLSLLQTHTHTHTNTNKFTHTFTQTHTHTHTHSCTLTQLNLHPTCHTLTVSLSLVHIQTHMYSFTLLQTHTHSFDFTHTLIRSQNLACDNKICPFDFNFVIICHLLRCIVSGSRIVIVHITIHLYFVTQNYLLKCPLHTLQKQSHKQIL
jgi:hypothetical protein